MQYRFKTEGGEAVLEADPAGDDRLTVSVGGRRRSVQYAVVSEHHLHLDVDGLGTNVFVVGGGGEKTIVIRGVPYSVLDADVVNRGRKRQGDRETLPRALTPPMPSVVVRIPVKEGDAVEKGDAVIVLTAMKMETTLTAPYPGRVARINVAVGEKVMPGRILVDIEENLDAGTGRSGDRADA
jgi:3-methylcrotonyl-CoA carboxylase alpha subunit